MNLSFFPRVKVGVWLSLVERFVRDEEVAGSNQSPRPFLLNTSISKATRVSDHMFSINVRKRCLKIQAWLGGSLTLGFVVLIFFNRRIQTFLGCQCVL